MESVEAFFAPPQAVRGMQTLDRSVFRREITLPAIRLQEVAQATKFLQSLKDTVLRYPGIKKFVDIETGDGKVSPRDSNRPCGRAIILCLVARRGDNCV